MALDRNYFNSIRLEPVKRKFYDIYSVDNLLVDIRRQAELMNHRYDELREDLEEENGIREDLRKKGQILSEEILSLREELQKSEQKASDAEAKAAEAEQKMQEQTQQSVKSAEYQKELEKKVAETEEKLTELQRKTAEAEDKTRTESKRADEATRRVRELEAQLQDAMQHRSAQQPAETEEKVLAAAPEIMEDMYQAMKKNYTSGLQMLEEQWQNYLETSRVETPSDLRSKISQIASVLEEINGTL